MKRCTKCGELKAPDEFYAARGTKDGLRGDCKACHADRAKAWYAKNRDRSIANVKRWQQENRERLHAYRRQRYQERKLDMRAGHLRRKFGITLTDYDDILRQQGGGCAICTERPEVGQSLHVDHDPVTGVVRGILCVRCNNALGQLKESYAFVVRAADYLDANGFVPGGVYGLRLQAVTRARSLATARR